MDKQEVLLAEVKDAFGLIRVDHVWDLEARSGASSEVSSARA